MHRTRHRDVTERQKRYHRRMASVIPLGPRNRTLQRMIGGAVGVPIGIGIVSPPHALLLGIGATTYVAYLAGWIAVMVPKWRRFGTENNMAIGALGRGEVAKARDVFIRWAPSRHATISAIARHNLGWALMLEGRLEEAATILEDAAEHHERALLGQAMLPTTRVDVGLCHALLGRVDLADAWRAKAELPVKAPPRPSFPGMLALLRGVIECRKGHAADATASLEQAWTEHEASMTGETLRVMRVLRAFACAAVDSPRNQGVVERILGDMKPRYGGEFGFLSTAWPEMAAFLAAHGLGD